MNSPPHTFACQGAGARRLFAVTAPGVEPGFPGSEPGVLPLDDAVSSRGRRAGSRTLTVGLRDRCSASELHAHVRWAARESNPQPSG